MQRALLAIVCLCVGCLSGMGVMRLLRAGERHEQQTEFVFFSTEKWERAVEEVLASLDDKPVACGDADWANLNLLIVGWWARKPRARMHLNDWELGVQGGPSPSVPPGATVVMRAQLTTLSPTWTNVPTDIVLWARRLPD